MRAIRRRESVAAIAALVLFGAAATPCRALAVSASVRAQPLVLDMLFSTAEVAQMLAACLHELRFKWGELDRPLAPPSGLVADLDLAEGLVTLIAQRVNLPELVAAGELRGVEATPIELYRAYVNLFKRGDHPRAHRDSLESQHVLIHPLPSEPPRRPHARTPRASLPAAVHHQVTALVYPHTEWSHDDGAETLFYDDDGEIVAAVRPRPGRTVLFTGDILHSARPPLPDCTRPRLSVALKWRAPRE